MTEPTRKPWQFSMREFILVVVAVSSLIALYVKNQRRQFQPTSFSQDFDSKQVIGLAMKNLGVTADGGSDGGGSSGSRRVSLAFRSIFRNVSGGTQSEVMRELRHVIEKQLKDFGCKMIGASMLGKVDDDSLYEFDIEYENSTANGLVRVRATKNDSDEWVFWTDILEY